MKFNRALAVFGLMFVIAAPITAAKASMDATLPCPVCHMPMTQTKTMGTPIPLMVHGKKWYCCAACGAGKKAAAYEKAHPGKIFVAEK